MKRNFTPYALLGLFCLAGCSKNTDPSPTPPPVTPPATAAKITSFTIADSIVPFNTGSTAMWSVNNTDNSTVTLNGKPVGNSGSQATGNLKSNNNYTLELTNPSGAVAGQQTLTLRVADSLVTIMWNGGDTIHGYYEVKQRIRNVSGADTAWYDEIIGNTVVIKWVIHLDGSITFTNTDPIANPNTPLTYNSNYRALIQASPTTIWNGNALFTFISLSRTGWVWTFYSTDKTQLLEQTFVLR